MDWILDHNIPGWGILAGLVSAGATIVLIAPWLFRAIQISAWMSVSMAGITLQWAAHCLHNAGGRVVKYCLDNPPFPVNRETA